MWKKSPEYEIQQAKLEAELEFKQSEVRRLQGQVAISISNHRIEDWTEAQVDACGNFHPGEGIFDLPFPQVPIDIREDEMWRMAADTVEAAITKHPGRCRVFVAGEPVLATMIVCLLQEQGYKPVAAVTERVSREETQPDGLIRKIFVFQFQGWRRYPSLHSARPEANRWYPPIMEEPTKEMIASAAEWHRKNVEAGRLSPNPGICPDCGVRNETGGNCRCPRCAAIVKTTKYFTPILGE